MKAVKSISIGVLCAVTVFAASACVSKKDVATNGEKPTLKILMPYQSFDPNEDISAKKIMQKTGYNVEFSMLPQRNADEKLMMEMAAGTEYDLIRLSALQFGQLAGQNTLHPLDDVLQKFGENILNSGSERAWNSAKLNGVTYGIPYDSDKNPENPEGIIMAGVGVRSDILEELSLSIPKDPDSFYATLKAIKEAKNISPLTGTGGFIPTIGSGFDLPSSDWCVVNDKAVARIKLPQTQAYLEYIAKLYREGLLDPDWPINKQETINQKFVSGKAVMTNMFFWDIPTIIDALKQNNPKAEIEFITPLSGSKGIPNITMSIGIETYEAIPKTSQNAEHAIRYTNLRSDPEIFVSTFIGEEGVHYEINAGKYFPILPAFDEYKNAKQFTGLPPKDSFQMWQARARKTPEMAVAYEKMNANVSKDMITVDYFEYANSIPEVQKYRMSLKKLEDDFYIKSMVSNEPMDKLLAQFIDNWEAQGGKELETAMNEWYQNNK